ncbi:carbon storage regulator [bacterium D16-76]|nr:carbon storage regulator [bacterium D16-76]
MLTLRIKAGECITIGEDISIHVYRWRGDSVELAVNAPREVAVRRKRAEEVPEVSLLKK